LEHIVKPQFVIRREEYTWDAYCSTKSGQQLRTLVKSVKAKTSLQAISSKMAKSPIGRWLIRKSEGHPKKITIASAFATYIAVFQDPLLAEKLPECFSSFQWSAYAGISKNGIASRWGSGNNHVSVAQRIIDDCFEAVTTGEPVPSKIRDATPIDAALAYSWVVSKGDLAKYNSTFVVFLDKTHQNGPDMEKREAQLIRDLNLTSSPNGINWKLE